MARCSACGNIREKSQVCLAAECKDPTKDMKLEAAIAALDEALPALARAAQQLSGCRRRRVVLGEELSCNEVAGISSDTCTPCMERRTLQRADGEVRSARSLFDRELNPRQPSRSAVLP